VDDGGNQVARSTARGKKRGGRSGPAKPRRPRKRGVVAITFDRLKSLITTVTLLATGALVGSWWIAWREADVLQTPNVEAATPQIGNRLKVEVLNGSGEKGAAGKVGDLLLSLDYDVVTVDNAEHFDYETSVLLDRSGIGQPVADLGSRIGADSIVVAPDPDLLLDATLILGKDWRRLVTDR
jgi:hypothetical protein